ncbi:hypothetical protein CDAR_525891 [Caerostris darwini]|uniref:Uncharacterized protein n=1 Tax=Caerostris darwini TaxID=1538125 RepID=A0AAV4S3S1_9ARAC|nr:hypothetical protein CDAR_525891 [Caerostris darwini]
MNLYYRLHQMSIYHRETMTVTSINREWVDNGESLLFHALFEKNFRSNPDGIWLVIMRFCMFHKSPDFDDVESSWRCLSPDWSKELLMKSG